MITNAALARQHQRWKEARERMKPAPKVVTLITAPMARVIEVKPPEPKPEPAPVVEPVIPDLPSSYQIARRILREVCEEHGVSETDLKSDRRDTHTVIVRHELMYLLKRDTRYSLPQIAKFCGGKDHTTVLSAARKHAERLGKLKNLGLEGLSRREIALAFADMQAEKCRRNTLARYAKQRGAK